MGLKNLFKKKEKPGIQVSKEKPQEVKDQEAKGERKINITEDQQKFYDLLQGGYYFMKYILQDLEKQRKQKINRPQRRRFEQQIRKARFDQEFIDVYGKQVKDIVKFMAKQNIVKKEVDGAKFYQDAKKKQPTKSRPSEAPKAQEK